MPPDRYQEQFKRDLDQQRISDKLFPVQNSEQLRNLRKYERVPILDRLGVVNQSSDRVYSPDPKIEQINEYLAEVARQKRPLSHRPGQNLEETDTSLEERVRISRKYPLIWPGHFQNESNYDIIEFLCEYLPVFKEVLAEAGIPQKAKPNSNHYSSIEYLMYGRLNVTGFHNQRAAVHNEEPESQYAFIYLKRDLFPVVKLIHLDGVKQYPGVEQEIENIVPQLIEKDPGLGKPEYLSIDNKSRLAVH
ncbi:hypothetical protein JXC34_04275 [Candidatus Woesearchaeota archaeon]|nr:hypothetical protein [Candidatus Woesearchaeota archaeon]